VRNCRAKGRRQEWRSIAYLERAGYRCVRAAGSLGAWDIIAIGTADVLLIQVKSNRWPGSEETEACRAFAVPPGVRRIFHRWNHRARQPEVRELGTEAV
jgi:Holliday junction resolvase-like predicted endonuclease